MPQLEVMGNKGRLIELAAKAPNGEVSAIQVAIKANAPGDLDSLLTRRTANACNGSSEMAVQRVADELVTKGWGIIMQSEKFEFKISQLTLRQDDPVKVMRYAPVMVDEKVYFCIGANKPTGEFRNARLGMAVSYVNPLTGEEFYRHAADAMERFVFARIEQVQAVLDQLAPGRWQTLGVSPNGQSHITLVTPAIRRYSMLSEIVPELKAVKDDVLQSVDHALVRAMSDIRQQVDPSNPAASLIMAARLLDSDQSYRFVRLANLYYGL